MTALVIRPVTPADHDDWLRLRTLLWPDSSGETHRAEMTALAAAADEVAFLALADGRVVGFAEAALHPRAEGCAGSPVGYLEGWYVEAGFRRRRIGARLVAAVETWAREHGCVELASDAHVENLVSQAAHTHCGFAPVSRLVHFRKRIASDSGAG